MAFKLAIAATVLVPMVFSMNDGGKEKKFNFKLECERLTPNEWDERIKGEQGVPTDEKVREAFLGIVTGWQGQTIVLDEDGQPAAFCREALEVMFEPHGLIDGAVRSYLKEFGAKVKN